MGMVWKKYIHMYVFINNSQIGIYCVPILKFPLFFEDPSYSSQIKTQLNMLRIMDFMISFNSYRLNIPTASCRQSQYLHVSSNVKYLPSKLFHNLSKKCTCRSKYNPWLFLKRNLLISLIKQHLHLETCVWLSVSSFLLSLILSI